MTLAYQSLVILVLLVASAVAALPMALRTTTPTLSPAPPTARSAGDKRLWLVETPHGRWFVNGRSFSKLDLEKLLQSQPRQWRVHYIPSDALPFGRVSQSMRWLRLHSPVAVTLELLTEGRSFFP